MDGLGVALPWGGLHKANVQSWHCQNYRTKQRIDFEQFSLDSTLTLKHHTSNITPLLVQGTSWKYKRPMAFLSSYLHSQKAS